MRNPADFPSDYEEAAVRLCQRCHDIEHQNVVITPGTAASPPSEHAELAIWPTEDHNIGLDFNDRTLEVIRQVWLRRDETSLP